MDQHGQASETDPTDGPAKKPFYRPRPLWIVPIAVITSLVRSMTLAPRVQVYTQLSCNAFHRRQHYGPSGNIYFPHLSNLREYNGPEVPWQFLSQDCLLDPAVQSGVASLQTTMATIMGILSVCSTTWWGHYGQKHGRTKVLAASTLGLLSTDLAFAFASSTSSHLSRHGYKFLLFASIAEGILGGPATLQAAISAYISDCTSGGSCADIFSRFLGVSHIGFSLGPTLGALFVRHPLPQIQSGSHHRKIHSMTAAFWAAILFSSINLILSLLVIPESLNKTRRQVAQKAGAPAPAMQNDAGLKKRLFAPLAVFAPQRCIVNGHTQEDWSMSWLATGLYLLPLAGGVFQMKPLYAEHVFGWDAEQLGYYISFVAAVRAFHTLLLTVCHVFVISTFNPSSRVPSTSLAQLPSSLARAHLARSITSDLAVVRGSIFLDIVSHTLVALHVSSSPLVFTGVTSISALAGGSTPALQSLAICILQRSQQGNPEIGALLGGLSMLTALGQILGVCPIFHYPPSNMFWQSYALSLNCQPVMFGIVYSTTVARFPEAVFALAATLVLMAFGTTSFIRTELPHVRKGKAPAEAPRRPVLIPERERGRSRTYRRPSAQTPTCKYTDSE
ncbi:MFS general substrate transporter [Russula emetica]|nr:MFS general substrate transporter [Russula emetica]